MKLNFLNASSYVFPKKPITSYPSGILYSTHWNPRLLHYQQNSTSPHASKNLIPHTFCAVSTSPRLVSTNRQILLIFLLVFIVRFSSLQPKVSRHSIHGLSKPCEKPNFNALKPFVISFFQLTFYRQSFFDKSQLSKSFNMGHDFVVGNQPLFQ